MQICFFHIILLLNLILISIFLIFLLLSVAQFFKLLFAHGISLHFTLLSVMFTLPLLGVVHFFKSLRSPKLIRVFYPVMKIA